ncbi:MAG: RagB/SusD family nutrient uptake outer membrane protein [Saprospiraceae bacterium]
MKYQYIILSILAVFAFACEDQLEIDPQQSIAGELAVSTEDNIQNILIGIYDEAGQGASHGGSLQVISDLLGNVDQATWGGTFLAPAEIANKTILPDNGFVGGFWNNAYEVINQANIVLDNIDIVTSDADKKNRIEGEARFLRALNYYELIKHFGSGSTGVPLRTTGILDYAVDLSIARASTSEVYSLIVSDLQSAYNLLPETNSFFADKYAAQALLARVYLYQGNFSGARDAADDVLTNSGHSLASSFAGAFNNDSDGPEDIFSFQVTSQTGTNSLITYYASEGNGGRGGDITVNDEYVALFDDAANDERAGFFYISPDNGGRLTAKYTNQFANVPILRIAEMHLIRIEANFEEGSSVGLDPLTEINALRARSGAAPLTSIDKATILLERQRELAFEGFFIHDLKRTQSAVGNLSWDAPSLVLPIPQAEMDTNASMTQNSGY